VVVTVIDAINGALTGREGSSYRSPEQPRAQALELVRLLVGWRGEPLTERASWSCAIAGGRRTVTIEPAGVEGSAEAAPDRDGTT
jgi:hypothetical protein